jgi:hypothetical protein
MICLFNETDFSIDWILNISPPHRNETLDTPMLKQFAENDFLIIHRWEKCQNHKYKFSTYKRFFAVCAWNLTSRGARLGNCSFFGSLVVYF